VEWRPYHHKRNKKLFNSQIPHPPTSQTNERHTFRLFSLACFERSVLNCGWSLPPTMYNKMFSLSDSCSVLHINMGDTFLNVITEAHKVSLMLMNLGGGDIPKRHNTISSDKKDDLLGSYM
jgi:hypothetical protein